MNTHEEFVTLETAKMLKRAGFDWSCKGYITNPSENNSVEFSRLIFNWNEDQSDGLICYSAPTQAVAMRWLREVKGCDISLACTDNVVYIVDALYTTKSKQKKVLRIKNEYGLLARFETYEQAAEAGIQECLKIILNEQEQ